MDLLQHLVDVDGIRFGPLLLPDGLFWSCSGDALLGDLLFSDGDGFSFGGHFESVGGLSV